MVIFNYLGKIERICISKKMGLYLSNLPDGGEDDWNSWQEGIKDDIRAAYEIGKATADKYINKFNNGPSNQFIEKITQQAKDILNVDEVDDSILLDKYINYLSSNMICMEIDYQNCNIPDGENAYSCFEGGSCEDDPVIKIFDLICFIFGDIKSETILLPSVIYFSCSQDNLNYRSLLWMRNTNTSEIIASLKYAGQLLDNFLNSERDYYQLDYLCNALYKNNADLGNTYHYMKLFSLCEMLLGKENDLDLKLPYFMDDEIPPAQKEGMAELLRKIRNKIAHGDFENVSELLEEYAQEYMEGRFQFDYFEHSRNSWVMIHISCILQSILQRVLFVMLTDKDKLEEIRNIKKENQSSSRFMSYDIFMKRLLQIQSDCNHEAYLSEVILPLLKMCCTEDIKCIPVYDDRATGRKTENETPCKKRMRTICAKREDGHYVVPDYIFVKKDYSFDNPQNPILMVETKNLNVSGNKYRKLADYITSNRDELLAEIDSCGIVIFTDGITWMFLEKENGEIVESKKYETIELAKLVNKINKTYTFSQLIVSTKWKELIETIKRLLCEIVQV